MTQGEILKLMADAVVENENCVLDVTLFPGDTAVAHLVPANLFYGEDFDDEED
jgi:hypothetical protein